MRSILNFISFPGIADQGGGSQKVLSSSIGYSGVEMGEDRKETLAGQGGLNQYATRKMTRKRRCENGGAMRLNSIAFEFRECT